MPERKFHPFPVITTDRLVLRPLDTGDARDIFDHRSDEKVTAYLQNFRHHSLEQTKEFIARVQKEISEDRSILWVITEKGKNKFIGSVCLWNILWEQQKAETGYTLDSAFHRKGYMHEALEKVIHFGFDTLKLKTIEAYTHEDNEASRRLLIKNNFKRGTILKEDAGLDRIVLFLTKASH